MTVAPVPTLAPSEERVLEEATRWFVRARSDSLSEPQRAELLAWLKAAPEHAAAMDVVSRSWTMSEQAGRSDVLAPALLRARSLRDSHGARARGRARIWFRGAAFAGAALATAAAATFILLSNQQTYATPRGEQLNTVLPDGTRVRLDSATRLEVRYGVFSREVRLVRGEAEFDVGHGRWMTQAWRPSVRSRCGTKARASPSAAGTRRCASCWCKALSSCTIRPPGRSAPACAPAKPPNSRRTAN